MQASQITAIELYRFDRELSERRFHGEDRGCMCGLFTITASNGLCGCSEFTVPCTQLRGDFIQWAIVFQRLKGMTTEEGMTFIHRKQETWGDDRVWLAESALIHMEHRGIGWDRAYLFDHSQAYVAF